MNQEALFSAALGITPPWEVTAVTFSKEEKRLDITIDFPRGSTFSCPVCGAEAKAYDTTEETWRHLNFFQYEAYLHARVPRVNCPNNGCGIKKIAVPWARPGSGFTLLFEALVMALVRQMPVKAAATILGEHDTRLWRVIDHYVGTSREKVDMSLVNRIGIDETAARRGRDYISLFFDLDEKRLLFGTPGKDHQTVTAFADDLAIHGGDKKNITSACIDMSKAFIKGLTETFPHAAITFDQFHLIQLMNNALGNVRAEEARMFPELLKGTRYVWLKNPENLTEHQDEDLVKLSHYNLKTGRAYRLKLALQDVFFAQSREDAEPLLKSWYDWAIRSQVEQVKKVARTVKEHWNGILNWFDSKLSNGFLEGINSLLQAAKARARGYRSTKNLINMAYMIAGKLDFALPT
jgi:transposase